MPRGDEDSGWGEPMLAPSEWVRAALAGALILGPLLLLAVFSS